jgi:hypothetical protein
MVLLDGGAVVVVLINVVDNHSKSICYKGDGTPNLKAHITHAFAMVNSNMLAYEWQREFQPDILCTTKVPISKCTNNVENTSLVCVPNNMNKIRESSHKVCIIFVQYE